MTAQFNVGDKVRRVHKPNMGPYTVVSVVLSDDEPKWNEYGIAHEHGYVLEQAECHLELFTG